MTRQGLVYLGEEATFRKKDLKLKEEALVPTTELDTPEHTDKTAAEKGLGDLDAVTSYVNQGVTTSIKGNNTTNEPLKFKLSKDSNQSDVANIFKATHNYGGSLSIQPESKQYSAKLVEMRRNSIPFTKKGLREYLKKL